MGQKKIVRFHGCGCGCGCGSVSYGCGLCLARSALSAPSVRTAMKVKIFQPSPSTSSSHPSRPLYLQHQHFAFSGCLTPSCCFAFQKASMSLTSSSFQMSRVQHPSRIMPSRAAHAQSSSQHIRDAESVDGWGGRLPTSKEASKRGEECTPHSKRYNNHVSVSSLRDRKVRAAQKRAIRTKTSRSPLGQDNGVGHASVPPPMSSEQALFRAAKEERDTPQTKDRPTSTSDPEQSDEHLNLAHRGPQPVTPANDPEHTQPSQNSGSSVE